MRKYVFAASLLSMALLAVPAHAANYVHKAN